MRRLCFSLLALALMVSGAWLFIQTIVTEQRLVALMEHGRRTIASIVASTPHWVPGETGRPRTGGHLHVSFHTQGGLPVNATIPVESNTRATRRTGNIEVVYLPENPAFAYISDGDGMMRPVQMNDCLAAGAIICFAGTSLLLWLGWQSYRQQRAASATS